MFPIFMLGIATGIVLSMVIFHFVKSTPSNAKFKLQEEQLKNAQADLQMFEAELAKAKQQIEMLKSKQAKLKKESVK